MATVAQPPMELRHLGPEAWGSRLTRAREEAGYGLKFVATMLGPWVSRSTLSTLEHRRVAPRRPIDRTRVLMCLVLYGVDPGDFDLDLVVDAPKGVDLDAIYKLGLETRTTPPPGRATSVIGESSSACTRWLRDRYLAAA